MCIAIPMKIDSIESPWALVNAGGLKRRINIELTQDVKIGDYVLVHAGYAIQKLEKSQAEEDLKLWKEIAELQKE